MTKRALIIIAIIVILPLLVTLFAYCDYCATNPVVAEYGGDVRVIVYEGVSYHAVDGDDEYMFRFGDYLGRVGDRTYGASLYRVKDDATGKYLAIANGTRRILYTESGELCDGIESEDSAVTRVVLDNFAIIEEDEEDISLICALNGLTSRTVLEMADYVDDDGTRTFEYFDVYFAYDGSAILTNQVGRIIHLTEKNKWLFVSHANVLDAEKEAGDDIEEASYVAFSVSDVSTVKLFMSYVSGENDIQSTTKP